MLVSREKCTGCMACYNICKHDAIQMKQDVEGFFYPIIDESKCISCGSCTKSCPELQFSNNVIKSENARVYALINHLDIKHSSSGGAFSLFARWILSQGGIVYGATMDNEGYVYHTSIESVDELHKIQGSKYVQSYIGLSFREIRQYLKSGRLVLFVGVGCQVSGLYSFLHNRYEGLLYTIDLICHGVPSNAAFRSYVDKLRIKRNIPYSKLEDFSFRKLDGWAICPSVKFMKSKRYYLELSENAFMNSFFKGILFRESCYQCSYCSINRIGTFTLADFWGIGKHGVHFKYNINNGVSLLIDNRNMLKMVDIANSIIEERSIDEALFEQDNLKKPVLRHPFRDFAVQMLLKPDVTLDAYCSMVEIPCHPSILSYVNIFMKHLLLKTGLYNLYKAIMYKI